jgi:hypothetical protein
MIILLRIKCLIGDRSFLFFGLTSVVWDLVLSILRVELHSESFGVCLLMRALSVFRNVFASSSEYGFSLLKSIDFLNPNNFRCFWLVSHWNFIFLSCKNSLLFSSIYWSSLYALNSNFCFLNDISVFLKTNRWKKTRGYFYTTRK